MAFRQYSKREKKFYKIFPLPDYGEFMSILQLIKNLDKYYSFFFEENYKTLVITNINLKTKTLRCYYILNDVTDPIIHYPRYKFKELIHIVEHQKESMFIDKIKKLDFVEPINYNRKELISICKYLWTEKESYNYLKVEHEKLKNCLRRFD